MAITLGKKPSSVPVLSVFLVLSIGAAGYFYWMSSQTLHERAMLSGKLGVLESEKTTLSNQFAQSKNEVADLQKKISEMEKSLGDAKTAQQTAELELKKKTDEVSDIQNHYETRIGELERDIKRYADFSAILATEMKPIKEALLFGRSGKQEDQKKITVSSSQPADKNGILLLGVNQSVDLIAGQVLAVNREYGFVVASIGSNGGAEPGRVIQIYRRGEPLGLCRIERAQENVSAASMVSEDLIARVEKGDRVVLL